jgi:glycosyltransferase involved in cell wall biosynthesis
MRPMRNVCYLCLQATVEGQASHAHVHEIARGLRELGWRVDLFEPTYASSGRRPGMLLRLREFLAVQVRLLLRLRRADVVYIRWHFATILTALVARIAGKKVVQEVNGTYEDLLVAWPRARVARSVFGILQRAQLRMADGVVVVTDQLGVWVHREGARGSVAVIPNGANPKTFTPTAKPMAGLPAEYVVFVGSLAPWHGIPTILEAFSAPAWPVSVGLVVAGSGQMENRMRSAAQAGVRYLGVVPYADVPSLLVGAVASLCCSRAPTAGAQTGSTGVHPVKLFEAMACGIAVIATDEPGQADLVSLTGAGVVIPAHDPHALARAVAWMATHPEERAEMGRHGRLAVEQKHSWRRRAEETGKLLERVLDASTS